MAFGFGIAAVALSPWLVLRARAAYREGPAFQRGLWNAVPLWGAATTGVLCMFASGGSLVEWVDRCLPETGWNAPGVVVIALGIAVALLAMVRMILGRIRVGSGVERNESGESSDESLQQQSPGPDSTKTATNKMPAEWRRVIVAYALTYGAAAIVIVVGAGLAW
ncbi:hypothetical protein [Microbacterium sp. CGR1]|uniref:hypothetical protein n=1 Tax=Microbacterium sp. CGR1 TaxID=1696072 RepID=UPI003DA635AF